MLVTVPAPLNDSAELIERAIALSGEISRTEFRRVDEEMSRLKPALGSDQIVRIFFNFARDGVPVGHSARFLLESYLESAQGSSAREVNSFARSLH